MSTIKFSLTNSIQTASKPYLIRDFNQSGLSLTAFKDTLYLIENIVGGASIYQINNDTGEISAVGGIEGNQLRFIVLNERLYGLISYPFGGYTGIGKVNISTSRLVIEQRIDFITSPFLNETNGTYYFQSFNYSNDTISVWKIDNNTGNFVELLVRNYPSDDYPSFIDDYVEFNDTVYFTTGNTDSSLKSLWKIDNSTGNEVLITDINTGSNDDYTVGTLFNLNGVLYFVASDSNYGTELWKLDSSDNPQRVTDINPGAGSASPKNFVSFNNTLYFIANDGTTGEEWWKIDNTTGKAVQVEDINPGAGSIAIDQQFTLNDAFYFSADDGITGIELWKIDPITDDAVRLTDINPGSGSANLYNLTNVNGTLYFYAYANPESINNGLWKIDNTGKAVRFVDTLPESGLSNIGIPTVINGKLYFRAYNATYGFEWWEFDESSNQLRILTDAISPGTQSSNIFGLAYLNGKLYFDNDGQLWALDLNSDAITGTSASETVNGTDSNDVIYGLNGNDQLLGKAGNDILSGGAGHDTLDGGLGADTLVGGTGNDIYYVDNLGDVIVEEANAGTDLVQAAISWQLGDHLENLVLTGTTSINGTGNSRNNVLTGNSAANVLSGGDGNDWLFGLAGHDTLNGNNGNDILNGGKGNDIYYVDNLGDVIVEEANAGTDLVQAAISWQLGDHLENLVLTDTTSIDGTGNSRNNVLTGNSAANVLSGGDGNDWLFGLAGHDTLNGNNGNDILNGGKGNDLLIGGRGNDSLTGDAGRDSFQLSLPVVDDFDTITDFSITDDKILLSKAEFGLTQGLGVLNASAFRLGTSATTASDRLIYDQATGNLFFDTDGLSGNTQVQIAQLTTKPLLSNTHITIIA
ncbi:hypothetical protein ACQFX9_15860 [Aliinostoc sp. HNIBRCY26]|uniref:hypothetical protein n=1 Tax=Aliinostoc sp. HNIBRCY26 TaxID=3418997 RepID=UPI003D00EEC5